MTDKQMLEWLDQLAVLYHCIGEDRRRQQTLEIRDRMQALIDSYTINGLALVNAALTPKPTGAMEST